MRHPGIVILCTAAAFGLAACDQTTSKDEATRALQTVNAVDENNLNDVMLTASDPNEAVAYFKRTTGEHPDRIDLQRGLAKSLVRAKHHAEAVAAWQKVVEHPDATADDKVDFADALIRNSEWDRAEKVLHDVPPTHETFKRYKLAAMIADTKKEWKKADSFYETAVGMTTRPAPVLNNWGYSKLTRGDYAGAERLFEDAIHQDNTLFTAKNNLALARGAQRNYSLPVVPTTQEERAQLLYTMALSAIKQGDVKIGEGLLREAIETHPRHFDAAARSLRALEDNATG